MCVVCLGCVVLFLGLFRVSCWLAVGECCNAITLCVIDDVLLLFVIGLGVVLWVALLLSGWFYGFAVG